MLTINFFRLGFMRRSSRKEETLNGGYLLCPFAPSSPEKSKGARARFILVAFAVLGSLWIVGACTDADLPKGDEYLLRVGERKVTGQEFEQVLEIAKVAYPPTADGDPEILEVIRHRLLVEMIEELLISLRADELGITVSDEELEKRVQEIRQDYPEDTFDQIFVEQAVPFEVWKKRTRVRLLLDKVIAADLTDRPPPIPPTGPLPGDRTPGAAPAGDRATVRPEGGFSTAADSRYEEWIRQLAVKYPVEINTVLWKKLYGP
jgi:hypothetical protein